MRPLQASGAVSLVFEEPEGPLPMETDEGKLGQILRNLVSNALKFTEAGEVRVSARASSGGAAVTIDVADTGIGIAPEDHDRIFQEFGQVDGPVQRRVKGTGLGLALSRRMAELLGGTLTVRSTVGSGSVFTLTLPREYAPAEGPAAMEAAPPPSPDAAPVPTARAGRPRALVIDDEEGARYALASRLSAIPFDVVEAADPREGLRLAQESPPDAIFLDLIMPDMLGFDVLERLRENPATQAVPVVVVTSKVLAPEEESRLAARGAAHFSKEECARPDAVARLRHALVRAGWAGPVTAEAEHTAP
jgi:CheY-like chemotaxis protein